MGVLENQRYMYMYMVKHASFEVFKLLINSKPLDLATIQLAHDPLSLSAYPIFDHPSNSQQT